MPVSELVEVASVAAFPPGTMKGVDHRGTKYIVVNLDGAFFGLDGICSHEYAEMVGGYVTGDQVLCPLHGSLFDVRTGAPVNPPATDPLGTFPTKVVDGTVYLVLEG